MKPSWNALKRSHEEAERQPEDSNADGRDAMDPGLPALAEGDLAMVAADAQIFGEESPDLDADLDALVPDTLGEDALLPVVGSLGGGPHTAELPEEMEVKRPSLEEYKERWASKLEWHSRRTDRPFSAHNLCPSPAHQLWFSSQQRSNARGVSP